MTVGDHTGVPFYLMPKRKLLKEMKSGISYGDRLPGGKRNVNTTYGAMMSIAQTGWMKVGETIGLTLQLVGILTLLLGMR
ncbi:hypothetical protein BTVI_105235 [Pitangus sulphuratus]|nr:hypothetical protein BTVI_105235 [Pitangus sulphuratus]